MKRVYEMDTWRGDREDLNKKAVEAAKAYKGRIFTVTFGEWGTDTYLVFADSKEEAASMVEGKGKRRVREVTNCKKYN